MASTNTIETLLSLQQLVLNTEDNSTLLNQLLPRILYELIKNNLNYESLGLLELDASNNILRSFFTFLDGSQISPVVGNRLDCVGLFSPLNAEGMKLLQGEYVISTDKKKFAFPTNYHNGNLLSVVLLPIFFSQRLAGLILLGTSRKAEEVSQAEIENLNAYTLLTAVAFKMQDTQVSLTKITQEVYKMNAQLHQLDKLKDDFVSIASHELRTPMTAIRSYVWMALNRSDIPLSEKLKRYLTRTLLSTERLINLVNDMLNISRIESGRIEVKATSFNLETLIADVLYEVESKAKERSITLVSTKTLVPLVYADADKIHQILLNLISNALKFTNSGGKITLSCFSDGLMVQVSVTDTGVGIAKNDISRLFTKFGRLDNSYVAAATSGGTGLGLYICKNLIEMMGGKISASSEGLGRGSTFSFTIPVSTPALVAKAAKSPTIPAGEMKSLEPVAL